MDSEQVKRASLKDACLHAYDNSAVFQPDNAESTGTSNNVTSGGKKSPPPPYTETDTIQKGTYFFVKHHR